MKDQSGNLYIADAIIALGVLLIAMMMLNTLVSIPNPTYSDTSRDFRTSQDIMEILSGKVDFEDRTFLGDITDILKEGENSVKSITDVSRLCKSEFNSLGVKNYRFVETAQLNDKVLASSGDFDHAENVSTSTRSYSDYSYTLYTW